MTTIELVVQLTAVPPWLDHAQRETAFVADVLRLTRPEDSVFDLKGETIFRPRAFYWVLEYITKVRLERGLIADTIPEMLVATATHVAIPDCDQLPPRARRFLAEHYVSVGRLRVAGERLPCAEGGLASFDVVIPGPYRIVEGGAAPHAIDDANDGRVADAPDTPRVEVDGEPFDAGQVLAPGPHQLKTRGCRGSLMLVWAPAIERGFSPLPVAAGEVAWQAS